MSKGEDSTFDKNVGALDADDLTWARDWYAGNASCVVECLAQMRGEIRAIESELAETKETYEDCRADFLRRHKTAYARWEALDSIRRAVTALKAENQTQHDAFVAIQMQCAAAMENGIEPLSAERSSLYLEIIDTVLGKLASMRRLMPKHGTHGEEMFNALEYAQQEIGELRRLLASSSSERDADLLGLMGRDPVEKELTDLRNEVQQLRLERASHERSNVELPPVYGVRRDGYDAVIKFERPPTDDQMDALQEILSGRAPASAIRRSDEKG